MGSLTTFPVHNIPLHLLSCNVRRPSRPQLATASFNCNPTCHACPPTSWRQRWSPSPSGQGFGVRPVPRPGPLTPASTTGVPHSVLPGRSYYPEGFESPEDEGKGTPAYWKILAGLALAALLCTRFFWAELGRWLAFPAHFARAATEVGGSAALLLMDALMALVSPLGWAPAVELLFTSVLDAPGLLVDLVRIWGQVAPVTGLGLATVGGFGLFGVVKAASGREIWTPAWDVAGLACLAATMNVLPVPLLLVVIVGGIAYNKLHVGEGNLAAVAPYLVPLLWLGTMPARAVAACVALALAALELGVVPTPTSAETTSRDAAKSGTLEPRERGLSALLADASLLAKDPRALLQAVAASPWFLKFMLFGTLLALTGRLLGGKDVIEITTLGKTLVPPGSSGL